MESVLSRFLRYVRIDTQADELSRSVPSTSQQLDLCRLLESECRALQLQQVVLNEFGVLLATIPATQPGGPAIGWVAHVDTSPETCGKHVHPLVHENYQGGDIPLPGDSSRVIRVAENPELNELLGKTLVTTDGTTLLGADDKAGVAVIMAAAEYLQRHPEIPHGPIRLCFTCDEEIGRGVDHLDLREFNVCCAYTLDGYGQGEVDCETFSADLAVVTITGVNIHPSIGKGVLVNAVKILGEFLAALPARELSPETTSEREGFLHPYQLEGSVARATVRIILRDFETSRLDTYAALLEEIADRLRQKYPRAAIIIERHEQYRNMRDGLRKEPRAVAKALEAMTAVGLQPRQTIIRGGTDGSRLTELGLPTPNLSTGEHNPHSPLEWTCVEELETAVRVLVALGRAWADER